MPSFAFATFLIVCPTSFFLGILFSLFPYDYPLLWSSGPAPPASYDILETHLKLLYHSPHLITRILHIVVAVGLGGLITKLYKPSESNMLFDGGSLVLYIVGIIIYASNILRGLQMVDVGKYGVGYDAPPADVDNGGQDPDDNITILGREDNLKVLSASNTILALVLVGVLVLQAGQWYAERMDEKERQKFLEERKKKDKVDKADQSVTNGKNQSSGRESKKAR